MTLSKPISLKVHAYLGLAVVLLTASACSPENADGNIGASVTPEQSVSNTVLTSPTDIMAKFVTRSVGLPPAKNESGFINGDFENGTTGWTGCSAQSLAISNNAYDGDGSIEVDANDCFFQSVNATPGEDIVLSCYARVVDQNIWTGMGMGFSDSSWQTISESSATLVSGTTYARYDVRATVPLGASFISMWFYSETAALVDNCTLLPASEVPTPPVVSTHNLLDNGEFERVSNYLPDNWQVGCGGSAGVSSRSGDTDLTVQDGACVYQSLSASDIAAMRGNVFELVCNIGLYTNEYASISLNLDGEETVEAVPLNTFSTLRFTVQAPENTTNGFFSIYSESTADPLRVQDCRLSQVEAGQSGGGNEEDNLLANGSFDDLDANNKPQSWNKQCAGTWDGIDSPYSVAALELGGDAISCVSQELDANALLQLSENKYTLNCDAWNYNDNYALVELQFNGGTRIQHFIENTTYYEPLSVSGELTHLNDVTLTIYGAHGLRIDNCVLEAEDLTSPSTNLASIDVRVNVEGRDIYNVTGPYTFDVTVTNNGDQLLSEVTYTGTEMPCEGTVGALQPGQTFTTECTSSVEINRSGNPGSFRTDVTATGVAADSSVVSDIDSSGYVLSLRPNPAGMLSIKAKQQTISAGDDAIFIVSVAATGSFSGIDKVESDFSECEKNYESTITTGNYDVYECVIPNAQNSMTVTVNAVSSSGSYSSTMTDAASVTVE